jgi:hypothetical protein
MNSDDNATAGAIRSLLVNMPIPARGHPPGHTLAPGGCPVPRYSGD